MIIKSIPKRWRLLSGQNNWQNLLKPLDSDLQQYVIHYGAMAQATYDTFNSNRRSKFAGSSRYSRRNLFSRVGLVKGNPFKYEAVKYIYATSNICVPESFIVKSLSAKKRGVLSEVQKQVEKYKDEEISITVAGHSLGAALATLNAADIVCNSYNKLSSQPNKTCPVTAFNFGSPLVGDWNFRRALRSMNDLHILNVYNFPDIIPHLPPLFDYTGVGVALTVDSTMSPFLKPGDVSTWHNLEAAYLHPLAIARPGDIVERDIALVNKKSSALRDEYLIPTYWWCEKNKGMVQLENGSWILHDHETDDDDP
ncbi:hypothetical protein DH2020_031374 [Rehmannia glutinosa]|uniref:Phospholipase A1 n=1 Tax=Rehmannia glutinosa TaxID=99300 RepID=A0ABR0VM88_REHGL